MLHLSFLFPVLPELDPGFDRGSQIKGDRNHRTKNYRDLDDDQNRMACMEASGFKRAVNILVFPFVQGCKVETEVFCFLVG